VIPIGINLTSIGVSSRWWLASAQAVEAAGFAGAWCWDHFISQGRDKTLPVLECWTTLTAVAATSTRLRVGSFVTNVMNRQPAVLARMLATISDQSGARVDLGIGVGGNPDEMAAYGIPFPDPPERVAVLEEAVDVLRLLWRGGPARVGDGWTTNAPDYDQLLPIHLAELEAHGRQRSDVVHIVAVPMARDEPLESNPLIADMAGFAAQWQERGADELIVNWVRVNQLPAVLEAAAKAGLAG
jgi:alkanesulfonate monooxygenase SsuD/methylene tetrahydromethanopterin reductase-like flavin-dependent oxidoreductase (luciferase family)